MGRAPPAPRPAAARRSRHLRAGARRASAGPAEPRSAAAAAHGDRPRAHIQAGRHRRGPGGDRPRPRPSGAATRSSTRCGIRRSPPSSPPSTASSSGPTSSPSAARGRPTSSASAATSPGGSSPAWPGSRSTSSATRIERARAAPRRGRARPAMPATALTLQSLVALHRRQAGPACSATRPSAERAARPGPGRSTPTPTRPSVTCSTRRRSTQALRFDPSRAAAADRRARSGPRRRPQVLRVRLALLERDDRAAAALLAELPPPTTRRARVERGVLCALSVLDRDVERANRHLRDGLDAGRARTARPHRSSSQGPDVHQLLQSYRAGPPAGALRRGAARRRRPRRWRPVRARGRRRRSSSRSATGR